MPYLIPILYVIVSYTFFLLPGLFDQVVELQIISALLPFLMGVVNLIVVLTVGRKWSRKTLLNCTLIIKYGLIPFYLIGGCITHQRDTCCTVSAAVDGVVWVGHSCFPDLWIWDFVGSSAICNRLPHKIM